MPDKKFSIIADPNGAGWDFAAGVYEYLKGKSDQFEINSVDMKCFADGEFKPKIQRNIRKKDCFFIHDSNKEPSRWWAELSLVNQTMRKSSAAEIVDVLPFFKFERQDRKDESRVPISARAVADTIELYADGVLTLDIHNNAIDGFFGIRFDNLYSFETAIEYIQKNHPEYLKNVVVMSPDAGGATRAEAFARRLGIEDIAIGHKLRKGAGIVDKIKIIGEVSGRNVFMVDDILDSGGTMRKAAEEARKQGAKGIYAYCTHGLFTKGYKEVLPYLDRVFVSSTLNHGNVEGLESIPMEALFGEAIYRIALGRSLSELFDGKK